MEVEVSFDSSGEVVNSRRMGREGRRVKRERWGWRGEDVSERQ